MRPVRILVAVAVGVLTSLVLAVPPAFACSCVAAGPADFASRADVVLVGTVTGVRDSGGRSTAAPVLYRVAVERVLQGRAGADVEVRSARSSASCGLQGVVPGRRYVFFADHGSVERSASGGLWADLCGGTAPATPRYVAAVAAVAGGAQVADGSGLPDVAAPPVDHGFPVARTAAGVGAGVAVVAIGAVLLRRNRGRHPPHGGTL